ncbi:SGNH/GDSL hydrolase family protein [Terrabacter sp. MAHUQ-38]|uniref:SGNH/GDSL hydrolase family protein n=1 Tax=unclassified Terrabacter TaxID=2630222 RepID=UPI00165DA6BA|nr:SGNH/GDSL hydrolase family protein [Terrabacter sp. MAHUQ-38]MBC9821937.1 SGNH/GDSL hydrolase family protein [Terrabacter sp. MAHUQ-38]
MRRSRTKSALLGLVILLVNVSIVVAVVSLTGGGPDGTPELPPSAGAKTSSSGTPVPGTKPPSGTTPAATALAAQAAGLVGSGRGLTIAVLGDGTGDEDGEWVQVMAKLLGQTHQVKLRNLNESDPTRYDAAVDYGTSGPKATVWNGSRRDVGAAYAARRLDFLVPARPDVVLLSYGRNNTASTMPGALNSTYAALRARWPAVPVLVVLQAQDRDDAIGPVRVAAEDWAATNGVPTVDVAGAFSAAGDPNRFVSVVDPPSVNSKGGRLWARTVFDALGGDVSALPADGSLPETTPPAETTPGAESATTEG